MEHNRFGDIRPPQRITGRGRYSSPSVQPLLRLSGENRDRERSNGPNEMKKPWENERRSSDSSQYDNRRDNRMPRDNSLTGSAIMRRSSQDRERPRNTEPMSNHIPGFSYTHPDFTRSDSYRNSERPNSPATDSYRNTSPFFTSRRDENRSKIDHRGTNSRDVPKREVPTKRQGDPDWAQQRAKRQRSMNTDDQLKRSQDGADSNLTRTNTSDTGTKEHKVWARLGPSNETEGSGSGILQTSADYNATCDEGTSHTIETTSGSAITSEAEPVAGGLAECTPSSTAGRAMLERMNSEKANSASKLTEEHVTTASVESAARGTGISASREPVTRAMEKSVLGLLSSSSVTNDIIPKQDEKRRAKIQNTNDINPETDDSEDTDLRPCMEDRFEVASNLENQSTEARAEEPVYHTEQVEMAKVLKERINEILFRNEKSRRHVSNYKRFKFLIYTAKSKMLEEQTITRLCDPRSECFSEAVYENFQGASLHKYASQFVWKYSKENIEKAHKKLMASAEENPGTLFLIVADEAHSAITKETGNKKEAAANNTVVNSWDADRHPNVIVLQVTATPFNLLTNRSKIPATVVAKLREQQVVTVPTPEDISDKDLPRTGRILKDVDTGGRGSHKVLIAGKDVTASYGMPKKLHHAKWNEQLIKRLSYSEGIALRIQVPADNMRWLAFDMESVRKSTFGKVTSVDSAEEATEWLVQGQDGFVEILSIDKRYQLVVYQEKDDSGRAHLKVGFLDRLKPVPCVDMDESFRLMLNYGEDIFQLEGVMAKIRDSGGQSTRKTVRFNPEEKTLELDSRDKSDQYTKTSLVPASTTHSFCIDTRRSVGESACARYVSLNAMFNSMRYKEKKKQQLRHDSEFDDLCHHAKNSPQDEAWIAVQGGLLTNASVTDLYAAAISYWIIVVENIQMLQHGSQDTFPQLSKSSLKLTRSLFSKKNEETFNNFEAALREQDQAGENADYKPVRPRVFKCVRDYYVETAKKGLIDRLTTKLPGKRRHPEYIADFLKALTMCELHLNTKQDVEDLNIKIEAYLTRTNADIAKKRKLIAEALEKRRQSWSELKTCAQKSETYNLVKDLIVPFRESAGEKVRGHLKIVKVLSIKDGNRLYKTVCIARKVAQKKLDCTFEVLRDYGSFDITSVNKESREPLFRVRRKLQPMECEFRDARGHKCKCTNYTTGRNDLHCISGQCGGKHKHREVRQYEDMRNLSGLLILLKKGRLGDTFPDTFTTLDLRISTFRKPETLAVITQDLGRMCRYIKGEELLPTALLGEGLYTTLQNHLKNQAVFHGAFIMPHDDNGTPNGTRGLFSTHLSFGSGSIPLDIHCKWNGENMEPDKTSFDYDNFTQHHNRILLEAEPQIGKTGVYTKLISEISKMICDSDSQLGATVSGQTSVPSSKGHCSSVGIPNPTVPSREPKRRCCSVKVPVCRLSTNNDGKTTPVQNDIKHLMPGNHNATSGVRVATSLQVDNPPDADSQPAQLLDSDLESAMEEDLDVPSIIVVPLDRKSQCPDLPLVNPLRRRFVSGLGDRAQEDLEMLSHDKTVVGDSTKVAKIRQTTDESGGGDAHVSGGENQIDFNSREPENEGSEGHSDEQVAALRGETSTQKQVVQSVTENSTLKERVVQSAAETEREPIVQSAAETEREPIEQSTDKYSRLTEQVEQCLAENSRLKEHVAKYMTENYTLSEQVEQSVHENCTLKEQVEQSMAENSTLEAQVGLSTAENCTLKEQVEQYVAEMSTLQKEIQQLSTSKEEMRTALMERADEREKLMRQKKLWHIEKQQQLLHEKVKLSTECAQLRQEIAEKTKQNESLAKMNEQLESKYLACFDEHEDLRKETSGLHNSLAKRDNLLREARSKLRNCRCQIPTC